MEIGQRIKEVREGMGLSQNNLANISGASQSAISEIEAGKRQPTFEVLEKIIVAGFNMSLPEFFTLGEQDVKSLPSDIWTLVSNRKNFHILRRLIDIQDKGISSEFISEWLLSLEKTITTLKKEYDYLEHENTMEWVAENFDGKYNSKLTEQEKLEAIELFKAKLEDPDFMLPWKKK
jgi:transcriptional regulator with XRE-family HTH domain